MGAGVMNSENREDPLATHLDGEIELRQTN